MTRGKLSAKDDSGFTNAFMCKFPVKSERLLVVCLNLCDGRLIEQRILLTAVLILK